MGLVAAAALLAARALTGDEPSAARRPEPASEADIKVAFLLNFARFVKWPAQATRKDDPIVVGVADLEPLRGPLSQLEKSTVLGRPFRVRHCRGTNDVAGCHILLINIAEEAARKAMLDSVRNKPVLTVGEAEEFLADGGIIRFVLRGDRVRLQISRPAATAAGLELSARLLEVAEKVVNER
jgi:hypothetical protein